MRAASLVLVLIGGCCLWVLLLLDRLVRLRNRVTTAWKRVDVELQRRHDLIPNVMLAVQSTVALDAATLTRVIDARNRTIMVGGVTPKAVQEAELSRALQAFFALVECHPELRSHARLQQLLEALRAIEYRLVNAAQGYNTLAAALNALQETFPSDVLAGTFHFPPATLFDVTAELPRD